ncbi:hypothetical protein K501DRAFT_60542 [Backusella circina FSU 941]|nr:hypothetical protein K501DRAFT_60542 [Backusella circina FSU 941]
MTSACCTCKRRHCVHVMATLLLYADMPIIFGTLSDTQSTVDLGSQKRDSETDDSSSSSKRQRQSQENADSTGFIPYGEPTQLVINLTNLPSIGEGSYDEVSSSGDANSQTVQSTQQPELSLGNDGSSDNLKEQFLSFPTLSSVGSIRYKDSLSNPLAYSPARVNLRDIVSDTTANNSLSESSKLKGSANLGWQAASAKQDTQSDM